MIPIINPFTLFGLIFLVMFLYTGINTKIKMRDPKYNWDMDHLKHDWKLFKILVLVDIILIIVGVILHFL